MSDVSTSDLGLLDLDRWAVGVPYDLFDSMRSESPVLRHPNPDGRDFWSVTGHAEVVHASRDSAHFHATANNSTRDQFDMSQQGDSASSLMMHMLNGRAHTRLRGIVSRAFTPRVVSQLEESTRSLARSLVTDAAALGEFDFAHEVSAELPLTVICDLMGIPEPDRPLIYDWTNRMMGGDDPEYALAGIDDITQAATEMYEYAMGLAVERRKNPGTDLTSLLLEAEVDGERLSDAEYQAFFQILSAAGNETTRNTISHGLVALLENPDQMRAVRDDRSLLPGAIEEMLRWASPVMHFARDVAEDTELGGQHVSTGDKVVLWYIAANRDPAVFTDPYRFDITRDPNPHTSFGGGGPHFCLGASLARMEVRVLFEELFDAIPTIELNGEVSRMRSHMFHGLKHVPVRVSA